MSSKRKSFVLHKDSLDILSDLDDNQAGKLFKAIHAYQVNDEIELDQITKMVFLPFKNQFVRDDGKYEETCERRAIAGSKGGKQKVANASNCKQDLANVADSVSKNKNDNKSDNKSDNKDLVVATPKFSDIDLELAEWIFNLVKKVAPSSKKPTFKKWADDIRLMREVDKLTHREIAEVFKWANKDEFWKTNILSITKLRKQFPQLQAKMKGEIEKPTDKISAQQFDEVLDDDKWALNIDLNSPF